MLGLPTLHRLSSGYLKTRAFFTAAFDRIFQVTQLLAQRFQSKDELVNSPLNRPLLCTSGTTFSGLCLDTGEWGAESEGLAVAQSHLECPAGTLAIFN